MDSSKIKRTALEIIKSWFLNSPSHGIRRINRSKTIPSRLFWSIIFLIFTTLMCKFIHSAIEKFITHPTKINLSVRQYQESMHYPAVTFCNLNPLRSEKFLEDSNGQRPTLTENEYRIRFTEYMSSLLVDDFNNKRPTYVRSGYQLNDVMVKCTFNGRLCHRNLTSFFHPFYGNCYTFHHDEHVESRRQTSLAHFWSMDEGNINDGYKLFLELFLFEHEYISHLDDRAAFRIFLHRKHEIPILSQTSLFVAPTVFTKLIFSYRKISFSQQCRTDLTDDMKQIFTNGQGRYSQALCYKLCELRFLERLCKCTDQVLMVFFQFFRPNHSLAMRTNRSCSFKDKCLANRIYFNAKKACPQCLPECELIQYNIQSSYADYPNMRSAEKVKQRLEKHLKTGRNSPGNANNSTLCSNTRKELILDNIVAVEISASPYATEILAESPMYTWVDLISSIGGQTGLWIGVSLISFVEIIELFFLLLHHFLSLALEGFFNRCKMFYGRLFHQPITTRF